MAERYGNAGWCLHVVNDAQDSGRGAKGRLRYWIFERFDGGAVKRIGIKMER